MAASCRTLAFSYVRTIHTLRPTSVSLNTVLLPSINCKWNSFRCQSVFLSPGEQICHYPSEHYFAIGCIKGQKWTRHGYNLNLTRYYSSSPPSGSTWAIVRLIQKAGSLSEKILYRISPKLHGFYRQFIDGGKSFIKDVRFVYRLRGRMKEENLTLKDLDWRDIYIKDKVTRDMGKVIPTMIVTWLPFAFYVMLPLIFTFPRQFLSDHFLNKEQLAEFQRKSLKRKYREEEKIWKLVKDKAAKQPPPDAIPQDHLSLIKSCPHIDVKEVLKLRPSFENQLRLEELSREHLVSLCKLHSLLTLMLPSSLLCRRLTAKCNVLQAIDAALRRDDIENIQEDDIRKLCYQRVFETSNTPVSTMQESLKSWLRVTSVLRDNEHSLYLHLPLFKKKH